MRSKDVFDAQQVNIPAPAAKVESLYVTSQGRYSLLDWSRPFCCLFLRRGAQEKYRDDDAVARTKTDTGR